MTLFKKCEILSTIMNTLIVNSFRNITAASAPQGMEATADYCVVNHSEIKSPTGRDMKRLGMS